MVVAAFAEVGRSAREVLVGTREGVYSFDQKATLTTKTSDGVGLLLGAIRAGDKADLTLKTTYRCTIRRMCFDNMKHIVRSAEATLIGPDPPPLPPHWSALQAPCTRSSLEPATAANHLPTCPARAPACAPARAAATASI